MIAFVTALLAVAKPLLDMAYFNKVMGFLNEYEDVQKRLAYNLAQWPNIDDEERGFLLKEKTRLKDALEKQAAIIMVKT